MLNWLKLHQFRYIKPGTELMFAEHFNVLLGRNGTGKTTLLDLLSMILRSDFSTLREEEFDIEYEFTEDRGTGWVRFANKLKTKLTSSTDESATTAGAHGNSRRYQPHVMIKLHLDESEHRPEVEVEVDVDGVAMSWRRNAGDREGLGSVDVFEEPLLAVIGDIIISVDEGAGENFNIAHGLRHYHRWTYRFDESLGVFESITEGDAGRMPKPGRAPAIRLDRHFLPDIGESVGMGPHRTVFVPPWYKAMPPRPGQSSTSVELSSSLALAKFPELTGIKKMAMSLVVERSWLEGSRLWWRFGHADFLFSGLGSVEFSHNFLSYGQKRLLAFLYYLDASSKFVIADELVNGMHHDWIRACIDQIGARQSFLTSQNPLMLDYLPLESAEQVQKSFIQCRAEVVGETTQIVWSNLRADDAEELFADYQVGVQHVGEILRVRGLW